MCCFSSFVSLPPHPPSSPARSIAHLSLPYSVPGEVEHCAWPRLGSLAGQLPIETKQEGGGQEKKAVRILPPCLLSALAVNHFGTVEPPNILWL